MLAAASAVLAGVFVGPAAAPASAHTISGPRPSNYRSRVVSITPSVPGISARIVDLGAKIEITNRTSTEITVLGYEDEPYLRIGPSGVFENLHSQATYINRTRAGGSVPTDVDTSPAAVPQWRKISGGHTARWHDHRVHWMNAQPPPLVALSPGTFRHLSQQNVVFVRDGQKVNIAVALDWVPGPSGLPWIPAVVALAVLGALAAALARWWRVLAALVCVLVVSDAAHAIAYEIPRPGGNGAKVLQFVAGGFVSIAVWIAAVPTVAAVLRRRVEALYGVVFVALLVALIGGATDLSALWKSQLPDAGPAWVARLEVVVALGLGAGLAAGAFARMLRSRAVERDETGGRWLSLLVAGLSDSELVRIANDLDADDVLDVALRELAARAGPIAGELAHGSVAFVVTDLADRDAPAVWSLGPDSVSGGVRAAHDRVEPVAAEIHASFPVMLQLLAGTVRVDDAVARGLLTTTGDAAIVARLGPYLPEAAPVRTAEGPAPAS